MVGVAATPCRTEARLPVLVTNTHARHPAEADNSLQKSVVTLSYHKLQMNGVNHSGHGSRCVGEYDNRRGLSASKDVVLVASGGFLELDEHRHRAPHQEAEEKDRELALRRLLLHEFPFRRTDQAMPRVAEPILT